MLILFRLAGFGSEYICTGRRDYESYFVAKLDQSPAFSFGFKHGLDLIF